MTKKPYGENWKKKGYRVIEGNDVYDHYFGGQDCDLSVCKLCGEDNFKTLLNSSFYSVFPS